MISYIFVLGKITWAEYIALYIKFHNASTSDIRDSDDVNFIPGSLNLDCKYIKFFLNDEMNNTISAKRSS